MLVKVKIKKGTEKELKKELAILSFYWLITEEYNLLFDLDIKKLEAVNTICAHKDVEVIDYGDLKKVRVSLPRIQDALVQLIKIIKEK